MASSIATITTPVATKNTALKCYYIFYKREYTKELLWESKYSKIYVICRKYQIIPQQVNDMLDNVMYQNLIAYSSDRPTFNWKWRHVKSISEWIQKGAFIPQRENFLCGLLTTTKISYLGMHISALWLMWCRE